MEGSSRTSRRKAATAGRLAPSLCQGCPPNNHEQPTPEANAHRRGFGIELMKIASMLRFVDPAMNVMDLGDVDLVKGRTMQTGMPNELLVRRRMPKSPRLATPCNTVARPRE